MCTSKPALVRISSQGTYVEFGAALVQRRAAARARIDARRGVLVVFARARGLGALLAQNSELCCTSATHVCVPTAQYAYLFLVEHCAPLGFRFLKGRHISREMCS